MCTTKYALYQSKWGKLRRPFNGPYAIIGKCSTGHYLHDKYNHIISKAVVPSHLIKSFEKHKNVPAESNSKDSDASTSELSDFENVSSCV